MEDLEPHPGGAAADEMEAVEGERGPGTVPNAAPSTCVIGHAWKAQHHLYKLYHRIAAKKSSRIAVVAVARELVGFLWAVMQELETEQAENLSAAA